VGLSVRRSSGDNKSLFGGKGAGLCEMTQAACRCRPRTDRYYRSLQRLLRNNKQFPEGMWEQVTTVSMRSKEGRQEVRRREEPTAGFGTIRGGLFHAGNDGHGPEPWSNEETVTGLADRPVICASRWMLIVALLHCSVKS